MLQRRLFEDLLQEVNNDYSYLTYYELLSTTEWEDKRQEIIKRDAFVCKRCTKGDTFKKFNEKGVKEYFWVNIPDRVRRYRNTYLENYTLQEFYILDDRDFDFIKTDRHSFLHVHHKYYIKGTLPWKYKNDCFETLCVHCHYDLHQKEKVPVYVRTPNGTFEKIDLTPCERCNGAGILPQYDYYMGGICFRCYGAKYEQFITDKLKKRSKEVYERMKKQLGE